MAKRRACEMLVDAFNATLGRVTGRRATLEWETPVCEVNTGAVMYAIPGQVLPDATASFAFDSVLERPREVIKIRPKRGS